MDEMIWKWNILTSTKQLTQTDSLTNNNIILIHGYINSVIGYREGNIIPI